MSGNFCLNSDFHVNLGLFYVPHVYDMGPTALYRVNIIMLMEYRAVKSIAKEYCGLHIQNF